MILIDLQKAFDTINHEILINKMEFLRFPKDVILSFKSYLSNRKFKVSLNKTLLEPGKLLCGVPQESILGPLLFLLYMTCHKQLNMNYFCTQMTLVKYFNTVTLMKLKFNLIRTLV